MGSSKAMLSANIRHKPVCSWIDKFCRLAQPLHSSGAQQHGVPKREEVNNEPKSFWEIPGPKPIPILGNILLLRKYLSRNSFRALYKDGFDKYGEIFKFIIPGNSNIVVISDPNELEKLLRAEGKHPERDKGLESNVAWLLNSMNLEVGLGFASGERWQYLRSAMSKQIMPNKVGLHIPGINQKFLKFADYLKKTRDGNGRVADITEVMPLVYTNVSAQIIFGRDVDALWNPNADSKKVIRCLSLFTQSLWSMIFQPPFYKIYRNKIYRDMEEAFTGMYEVGIKFCKEVEEKIERGEEESEVQGLLEQWLREGKLEKQDAIMQAVDGFSAGLETTSNQSVFMLHEVAKHPDVQQKLHQEILAVMGDTDTPTLEMLSEMKYLKWCVMESFRFLATTNGIPRRLKHEAIIKGYRIPADTAVHYSSYAVSRNPKYFTDPYSFRPERWDQDDIHPFSILTFGFGPRSCYGKRFAEIELKLLLIQMVRHFKWTTELEELKVFDTVFSKADCAVPLNITDR